MGGGESVAGCGRMRAAHLGRALPLVPARNLLCSLRILYLQLRIALAPKSTPIKCIRVGVMCVVPCCRPHIAYAHTQASSHVYHASLPSPAPLPPPASTRMSTGDFASTHSHVHLGRPVLRIRMLSPEQMSHYHVARKNRTMSIRSMLFGDPVHPSVAGLPTLKEVLTFMCASMSCVRMVQRTHYQP